MPSGSRIVKFWILKDRGLFGRSLKFSKIRKKIDLNNPMLVSITRVK